METNKREIKIQLSEIQYRLLMLATEDIDTFMYQNQKANSDYTRWEFGEIYSPLTEGQLEANAGKILINLFIYSIMEGLDMCPDIDREDIIAINTKILSEQTEKQKILALLKSLTPEEIQRILNEY